MSLRIIKGSGNSLNQYLLKYAIKNRPSLIIDCSNCTEPHTIYKYADLEYLDKVYVIEVELLYAFRDSLRVIPRFVKQLGVKIIVITAFHYLINYHNEHENDEVAKHCIELIRKLSLRYNIILGVQNGPHSKKSKDSIGFIIR